MIEALKKKTAVYVLPALLVLVTALLYLPSLTFDFIWDDFTYVVNSPIMSDPEGLFKIWSSQVTADFWPLTYSVLWIMKQIFGTDTFGYHLVNLVLYITTVVLVYIILRKLQLRSALWAALLFAVHPMNVEVAVWIFQIKTNLANVLGLLAFYFWIRFVDTKSDAHPKNSYLFYFLTGIFLILSFLAKISLVAMPIIFGLYDYLKSDHCGIKKVCARVVPFLIVALLFAFANLRWDQNSFPTVPSELILEPSWIFRIALVGHTFWFYFIQTFWPATLTLVHPRWVLELSAFKTFILTIALFFLLAASAVIILRKSVLSFRSQFAAGLLFSFLLLLPVLGLTEIYFMRYSFVAEHWLTLGLLGFLVPGLEFLKTHRVNFRFFAVIPGIFAVALATKSYFHMQNFSSEKKLLQQNILENPQGIMAYNTLALILKNEDDYSQALVLLEKALAIKPTAQSFYSLGMIQQKQNRMIEAKSSLEKSIELNPYFSDSYNTLGIILINMQQYEEAIPHFNQALSLDPLNAIAMYNLGYSYEKLNQKTTALDYYQKALRIQPSNFIIQQAVTEMLQQ